MNGTWSLFDQRRRTSAPGYFLRPEEVLQLAPDDNFLTVSQIAAVEVHPRANFRPVEFLDMRNDCGSVVFRTNLRGPRR